MNFKTTVFPAVDFCKRALIIPIGAFCNRNLKTRSLVKSYLICYLPLDMQFYKVQP